MLSSIFVYDESPDTSQLDGLVQSVKTEKLNDPNYINDVLDEIHRCIDQAVSKKKSNEKHKATKIEEFAQGSSSCCFRTLRGEGEPYIFKVFSPRFYDGKNKFKINCDSGFNWISDDANFSQKQSWLKRYIRFIRQRGIIDKNNSIFGKRTENGQYQQTVLTSYGYAYRINLLYGDTLEDKTIGDDGIDFACKDKNTTIRQVLDCVENVRKAAEYIDTYCHSQGYYHGDIKPENFLAPNNFTTVINIDFDTWIDEGVIKEKLQPLYSATTQLYYDNISACKTIEDWKVYDVRALSKILMFMLIGKHQNDFNNFCASCLNCNKKIDWIKFFFASKSVGYKLFDLMTRLQYNTEKSVNYPMLFVFNKLKDCIIRSCSTDLEFSQRIKTISDFIAALKDIENLLVALKSGNAPVKIDKSAIRYLGLKRLDAERWNKPLLHAEYNELIAQGMFCDWAQYVIERNYYEQESGEYQGLDLIDRQLIPDIDLGDGSVPLAYRFDEKGQPISASPLEQALDAVGDKSLFLTAEGGQGKTTTLRSFWLDFLSGKNGTPCLYVDCKLLQNEDMAIEKYIAKEYNKINIDKLVQLAQSDNAQIILLLDGTNESNAKLRANEGKVVCSLVSECQDVIKRKYIQVVIGSRSKVITTINKENEKKYDIANNNGEFGDAVQYATVCELNDSQIQYCLGDKDCVDVEDKQPLIRLLRNNMMLHIYKELKATGERLNGDDMKPGILLDKFFQRCYRTRYVRSCIGLNVSRLSDKELYDEIIRIGDKPTDEIEEMIYNASQRYEKIFKQLKEICDISQIDRLPSKIYPSAFENLSIFVKDTDNHYIWANEIYQEYFQALYVKEGLDMFLMSIKPNGLYFGSLKQIYLRRKYNAFQFAGELFQNSREVYYDIIDKIERGQEDNPVLYKKDLLDIIAVIYTLCFGEFPHGIKRVKSWMFSDCDNISEIVVPRGVKSIGPYAFKGCQNLKHISISGDVDFIGEGAFLECSNIESITVESSNRKYSSYKNCLMNGRRLIQGCKNSVIPSDGHIEIDMYAFGYCLGLSEIVIPNSVSHIGEGAFYECKNLRNIILSDGVISIGKNAFEKCDGIIKSEDGINYVDKWVVGCSDDVVHGMLQKNAIGISDGAFRGSCIKDIELPDSLKYIGDNAFSDCRELENIKMSNSLIYFGDFSFSSCHRLQSIVIPNTVRWLGMETFIDCRSLKCIMISRSLYYKLRNDCFDLYEMGLLNDVSDVLDDCYADDDYQDRDGHPIISNLPFHKDWNEQPFEPEAIPLEQILSPFPLDGYEIKFID